MEEQQQDRDDPLPFQDGNLAEESLAEALPVFSEEFADVLTTASHVTQEELSHMSTSYRREKKQKRDRWVCYGSLAVANLAVLVAIFFLGVSVGEKKRKNQEGIRMIPTTTPPTTTPPSQSPSTAPSGSLDPLLEVLHNGTLERLEDYGSAQSRAL